MSDGRRITEAQVRRELSRIDGRVARRRTAIAAAVILAVALLTGFLATKFLFTLTDIRTDGMSGTLVGGDVALSVRLDNPLWHCDIRRGALALVRYEEAGMKRQTVRRLIALSGDEVSVDEEGRVTLNGQVLDEPYATYRSRDDEADDEATPDGALWNPYAERDDTSLPSEEVASGTDDMEYPITVPEGAAFVLCDNRDNLLDSRSSRFGLVAEANLRGLSRAVIWPVYRAGLLDDGPAVG